jgi:serine/threonine-protein kinase RsbW
MREQRLTISAELNAVETACEFVMAAAAEAGLDSESVHHCRLSVEEICTNVIEHGYHNRGEGEQIDITVRSDGRDFSITISDSAPLFNPLALPDPDPSTPLWERQGGGWGVYFVKKFMDSVAYSNAGQRNHFTMAKRISV